MRKLFLSPAAPKAGAALWAVLCIALGLGQGAGIFPAVMAFPFAQIGALLRALSLSGEWGNVAALCLYVGLSLAPAAYLLLRVRKGRARAEDGLCALLSVLLFAVLYMMINPALMARHFGGAVAMEAMAPMLGLCVYAAAVGYLVLRAMRKALSADGAYRLKCLKILAYAAMAALIYAICGAGTASLKAAFTSLTSGNTDGSAALFYSYAFLILQYLVGCVPYAFGMLLLKSGLKLMDAVAHTPYGGETADAARDIVQLCRTGVAAILLSQITVNCLQLLLGARVRAAGYTLSIPLPAILLMLAAMLLAGHFEQARRLKEENDGFI